MLDNPEGGDATVKRYTPPQSRNRLLNRRKSGDRFDRTNHLHGNDGEKAIISSSKNIPATEHGEAGGSNLQNENPHLRLITVDGCCNSKAARLMNERWAAAMHSYNNPSVDATAAWWSNYGGNTPHLKKMAIRILSLTTSSSGCERNWSTFEGNVPLCAQALEARHGDPQSLLIRQAGMSAQAMASRPLLNHMAVYPKSP